MKRFILALAAMLTITMSSSAMSYEQARDQALFLTDKMAYELNLTDDQYEAAYEINLDYLMRVDSRNDLYGVYWRQRNLDLSYIMLDWQYRAYCAASYFYRPLYWDGGYWHFGVYARYPHRDFFYFGCPNFVISYKGGHSWHRNGGRSWYVGRRWDGPRDGGPHPGMRARFDNGHYGPGYRYEPGRRTWTGGPQNRGVAPGNNGNRNFGSSNGGSRNNGNRSFGSRTSNSGVSSAGSRSNGTRSFGTPRESSTRTTVTQPSSSSRSFGNRTSSSSSSKPSRTFTPSSSNRSSAPSSSQRSFGSSGSFGSHSSGSFGGGRSSGGNSGGGGSFGRR